MSIPANASTTCSGGTLTAVEGTGVVIYSGGSIAKGGDPCTVEVDVMSFVAAVYENTTGDLTSSLGNSGPASATLGTAGPGSSKNDLAAGWRGGVWGRAPPEAREHGGMDIH